MIVGSWKTKHTCVGIYSIICFENNKTFLGPRVCTGSRGKRWHGRSQSCAKSSRAKTPRIRLKRTVRREVYKLYNGAYPSLPNQTIITEVFKHSFLSGAQVFNRVFLHKDSTYQRRWGCTTTWVTRPRSMVDSINRNPRTSTRSICLSWVPWTSDAIRKLCSCMGSLRLSANTEEADPRAACAENGARTESPLTWSVKVPH